MTSPLNLPPRSPKGLDQTSGQAPSGLRLTRRRIRKSAVILPTLFTLGNALSGFMAVFFASRPATAELPWGWTPITFASLCIFIGMVFDALDGRIARLTRQTSDLGEQLDSMADMVTFGVAPAFIAVQLVLGGDTPYFASNQADTFFGRIALVVACIYVSCTALRLARFNIESRSPQLEDHLSFKGLPSPGAAGTVASMILLHQHFLADITRKHLAQGSSGVIFGSSADVPLSLRLAADGHGGDYAAHRFWNGQSIALRSCRQPVPARPSLGAHHCPPGGGRVVACSLAPAALAAGFVIYALSAPIMWLLRRLRGGFPATPTTPP
ncbi:MAG: hypothetical protein HC898_07300 [Phycisphaerales bacterium]|nr:hypothetical protein [Phycisphaerales bacterium]